MRLACACLLGLLSFAAVATAKDDPVAGASDAAAEKILAAWELKDWDRFDRLVEAHFLSRFRLAHDVAQAYWRSEIEGDGYRDILAIARRIKGVSGKDVERDALANAIARWEGMDEAAWARERRLGLAQYRLHVLWVNRVHHTILRLHTKYLDDIKAEPRSLFALFARINIASAYAGVGDLASARRWGMRIGELAEEAGWMRPAMFGYEEATKASRGSAELKEARAHLWRVTVASRDDLNIARIGVILGKALVDEIQPRAALPILEAAIRAARQTRTRRRRVLRQLFEAHRMLGQITQALAMSEEFLAVARSANHPASIQEGLYQVGFCRGSLGQFAEATDRLEEGLALSPPNADPTVRMRILTNLAIVRLTLGKSDEGMAAAKEAHSLAVARGGKDVALTHKTLAGAYMQLERWDQAREHLEAALALMAPIDTAARGALEAELATLANKLAEWDEADERYRRAVALFQKTPGMEEQLRGVRVSRFGNLVEAKRHKQALKLVEPLLASIPQAHYRRPAVEWYYTHALLGVHDWAGALRAARSAVHAYLRQIEGLSAAEAIPTQLYIHRLAGVGVRAALELSDAPVEDVLWLTEVDRGLQLSLALRTARAEVGLPDDLAKANRASLERVHRTHQRLISAMRPDVTEAQRAGAQSDHDAAWRARAEVVRRIQRHSRQAGLLSRAEPVSLDALRASLAPGEGYVSWMVAQNRLAALVVTPDGAKVINCGPARRKGPGSLSGMAMRFRDALATPDVDVDARARELYDKLFEPVRPALGKADRLLVSIPFQLGAIPLAALRSPKGRWLVQDYELRRVPSATVRGQLLRSSSAAAGHALLGIGNPDTAPLIPRLPHSEQEVQSLAKRFPDGEREVLVGKQATIEAVTRRLKRGRSWRVVHFACHGVLHDREAKRGGLVLAGPETWTVDAVTAAKIPAELVVLSACDSGRGVATPGEGILGLARAFLWSGAKRVIASSWLVGDRTTAAFFDRFYSSHLDEGLEPAAALRGVQLKAIESGGEAAKPHRWAAFVLWGG